MADLVARWALVRPTRGWRRGLAAGLAAVLAALTVCLAAAPTALAGPQLPPDGGATPEQAERRAERILEGDEYQGPDPEDETLLERVREWLGDRFPDFDGDQGASLPTNQIATGIVIVLVLAAVGAVIWMLVTGRLTRKAGGDDEPDDASLEVTPLRTPSEWADEAARCERAGDWRGAVRAHYRNLTGDLAGRGVVIDAPGRTAGEHRTEVTDRAPAAAPVFTVASQVFEDVWFGGKEAAVTDAHRVRDLAAQALDAAPRRLDTGDDGHDGDDRAGDPVGVTVSVGDPSDRGDR